MSRGKVAPTLRWGVREGIITDPHARRELRALLAVARAAERVIREDLESPGDLVYSDDWDLLLALDRALARLRSLSRPAPAQKRRK